MYMWFFPLQVIDDDQDKPNAMGINDKLTKSLLDGSDKETKVRSRKSSFSEHPSDEKTLEMKNQEEQLELLKQKSEEASKTIEKLKMQLQQQSDYEILKREIL